MVCIPKRFNHNFFFQSRDPVSEFVCKIRTVRKKKHPLSHTHMNFHCCTKQKLDRNNLYSMIHVLDNFSQMASWRSHISLYYIQSLVGIYVVCCTYTYMYYLLSCFSVENNLNIYPVTHKQNHTKYCAHREPTYNG